tara:strand:+ start:6801 stop:8537 length:1737 start_codon:yes stop_codon:yes gene_type:complete
MTAPSPVTLATSVVDFTITSNGSALDSTIQVIAIDVWQGVNRLPKARIVVSDGSAGQEDFPISDSQSLIPGAEISIALGYDGQETSVFTGIINRQGLEAPVNGPPRLVVEATDKAMVMTLMRANGVYQNITDSALCEKLIRDAGLSAKVSSTSITHESIVQYYATPWDLMITRAQINGMVTIVADGKVTITPPDTSASSVLTLTFGDSILEFKTEMDAASQLQASAIQSYSWNPADQERAQSSSAQSDIRTPGNISSDTLSKVFGVSKYVQQSAGDLEPSELTQWSSAELIKSQLAKIRGSVTFQGSALAELGKMVTLAGMGDRFNGDAWISGVHHRLAEGLWRTSVEIGLSPNWFTDVTPNIAAPGASGQLPPANNLQTGTVSKIDADPAGEFRILVKLPLLQDNEEEGVWARLGTFYASNGFGSFFYPEVGDEVIVGFLSGDPRYPIVLGSLYSKANAPALTPEEQNNTKSIMSRAKMHIDFLEEDQAVQIVTPGGQSVVINDKEKSIVLTDINSNSVTLGTGGIVIKSASDISMTANGSITISADSALSASGSASAELKSSGIATVKGATVALNP